MQSIAQQQTEYNATGAALDRQAAERGQLLADADAGIAILNALAAKWYEQGYTAGALGLQRGSGLDWSPEHEQGYRAAKSGRQLRLDIAGTPATYRSEAHS